MKIFPIALILVLSSLNLSIFLYGEMLFLGGGFQLVVLLGWIDVVIVTIFWAIWEIVTPTSSKRLRSAKLEKRMPIFIEHDNGIMEIKLAKETTPEGAIMAKDGWVGFVPRPQASAEADDADDRITSLITRRTLMPDIGLPVLFGCASKAILTNLRTVANLQHGSEIGNPEPKTEVNIGKNNAVATVFFPVTLTRLKQFFPKSWNVSQIRAHEQRNQLIGFQKSKKFLRGENQLAILGMVIALILVLSIIFFAVATR